MREDFQFLKTKTSVIFYRLISQYPNGQLNISFGSVTDLGTGFESETTKMIFILYTNKSESKPKRFHVNRDETKETVYTTYEKNRSDKEIIKSATHRIYIGVE